MYGHAVNESSKQRLYGYEVLCIPYYVINPYCVILHNAIAYLLYGDTNTIV